MIRNLDNMIRGTLYALFQLFAWLLGGAFCAWLISFFDAGITLSTEPRWFPIFWGIGAACSQAVAIGFLPSCKRGEG